MISKTVKDFLLALMDENITRIKGISLLESEKHALTSFYIRVKCEIDACNTTESVLAEKKQKRNVKVRENSIHIKVEDQPKKKGRECQLMACYPEIRTILKAHPLGLELPAIYVELYKFKGFDQIEVKQRRNLLNNRLKTLINHQEVEKVLEGSKWVFRLKGAMA